MSEPKTGLQLQATDGTAKGTVKLAQLGSFGQNLVVVMYPGENRAFVLSGQNLWITNGTRSGTRMVRRVASADGGRNVSGAVAGHILFFIRLSKSHGYQLWRSDGTAHGTKVVRDGLGTVKNWPPTVLAPAFGGVLYQTSLGHHGSQLWIAGSTTRRSGELHNFSSSVNIGGGFAAADGKVYFSAPDGRRFDGLWATDGTKTGTVVLAKLAEHRSQDLIQSVVSIPRPCCKPLVLFEAKGVKVGVVFSQGSRTTCRCRSRD
jgi:ELWxxDGT repeat protein